MKRQLIFFVTILIISACGGEGKRSEGSGLSGEIRIDGSSTVYPLTEAIAEEFRNEDPDIRVTVGESGTGGGFKKFLRGEIDINNASRLITKEEAELCKKNGIEFIELPVSYDGLAVVVNKENNFVDYLTVSELKKIWEPAAQGRITTWDQVRPGFPKLPLNLYGAGTASGTYDYFTEAVTGEAKASRGDYNASEDDNVLVKGVSSDKNALGYFGFTYYEMNADKLKLVPIDDENEANGPAPVAPGRETVSNGTYQPLSRPLFIYINAKAAEKPEMQAFIKFYMENAGILAEEIGGIALPQKVYQLALSRFEKKITGSAFSGESNMVGVNMADLLQAEEQK